MTIKRIKRKSIFSLGAVYVLLLMAFLLSDSCVYADKYDFSYESVHYWNRYSKNGRSIEVILGQSLMSIAIYNNNNVVFKEYFIGGTVLTNGKKVYLARKDTPHIRANIMCYDFEKGQYYTVAELPVENLAACNGKFLFYYKNEDQGGGELWRLNLATKKTKKILDPICHIKYRDGRYIIQGESGDFSGIPVYIMKKNGTGLKKICDAQLGSAIYKKKVFYLKECKRGGSDPIVQVHKCDFNGKNRKALTKKIPYSKVPEKYMKIFRSAYS